MTVVLRPSDIESGNFLMQEDHPALVNALRSRTKEFVDELLVIGNAYALGGDLDVVCLFDRRHASEIAAGVRAISETCDAYRMRFFDIIKLSRERDGAVAGVESNSGIGVAEHTLAKLRAQRGNGQPTALEGIFEQETARLKKSSGDPYLDDIVRYSAHKTVSLPEYARHPFDLENPACNERLGKILSYAGHAGAKIMRYETGAAPDSKATVLRWAEETPSHPHAGELAGLLKHDAGYRSLLQEYARDPSLRRPYLDHMRFVYEELPHRAISLARNVRAHYEEVRRTRA